MTDITGGKAITAQGLDYDAATQTLSYALSASARIFLRYGYQDGPMLGTLINSAVRSFGKHQLKWDGQDAHGTLTSEDLSNLKFSIIGYELPRNALMYTNGANSVGPTIWKSMPVDKSQRRSINSPDYANAGIHRYQDREQSRDFNVKMVFKNFADNDGSVVLNDNAAVRVDIAGEDKVVVQSQRFEVSLYIDQRLAHENEVSYVPYTWYLPGDLNSGEHVLTALVLGFGNHFGVVSRKFQVNAKTIESN